MNADRIVKLLTAVGTLFAELGPMFFHSEHGKAILHTTSTAIAAATVIEAEALENNSGHPAPTQ
jgi:hypothetical protein